MTEGKSGIVNPFAKTILSIEMKDDGSTKVQSSLSPDVLCKAMCSLMIDVIFQYVNAASQSKAEETNGSCLVKV